MASRALDAEIDRLYQLPLGGATSGSPSMYELNGRQYLLVTATASPTTTGPSGIVAFALPQTPAGSAR